MKRIRVILVDGSPVARAAVRRAIASEPDLEVVGEAATARSARDLIVQRQPDVVALESDLPEMGGLVFLRKLMAQFPMPTVVMGSRLPRERASREALQAGGLDYVQKPSADLSGAAGDFAHELAQKLRSAAAADRWQSERVAATARARQAANRAGTISRQMIAMGASTGGVEAIPEVLKRLPATTPGIAIVQHMPNEFIQSFAKRLDGSCALRVAVAANGDRLEEGRVLIAPGDHQCRVVPVTGGFAVRVVREGKVGGHAPSVEVLMQSVAAVAGSRALGVMLTGMGDDGAAGMRAMRDAGARTVAQNEPTCAVYGMPKAAIERGGVEFVRALDQIAPTILQLLSEPVSV